MTQTLQISRGQRLVHKPQVPYINPDPDLVAHWKRELAGTPGLKIGINLAGQPEVRRRPAPVYSAGALSGAFAHSWGKAVQRPEERGA